MSEHLTPNVQPAPTALLEALRSLSLFFRFLKNVTQRVINWNALRSNLRRNRFFSSCAGNFDASKLLVLQGVAKMWRTASRVY